MYFACAEWIGDKTVKHWSIHGTSPSYLQSCFTRVADTTSRRQLRSSTSPLKLCGQRSMFCWRHSRLLPMFTQLNTLLISSGTKSPKYANRLRTHLLPWYRTDHASHCQRSMKSQQKKLLKLWPKLQRSTVVLTQLQRGSWSSCCDSWPRHWRRYVMRHSVKEFFQIHWSKPSSDHG